jgi:hypothetical protein
MLFAGPVAVSLTLALRGVLPLSLRNITSGLKLSPV